MFKMISGLLATALFFLKSLRPAASAPAPGIANPPTCRPFTFGATVGPLSWDSLREAFSEVEKHGHRVAKLLMNPRDYYRDLHYLSGSFAPSDRRVLQARHGTVARLWGAEIVLTDMVAAGTVHVCADEERAVAVIKIVRANG